MMALYAFLSPFASSILVDLRSIGASAHLIRPLPSARSVESLVKQTSQCSDCLSLYLSSLLPLAPWSQDRHLSCLEGTSILPSAPENRSIEHKRAIVLHVSMGIFFLFSIGCALAQNTAQLAVFRFLSGLGGGAPLAIGAGVLADMWEARERGKAVAVFSAGPPIAPTLAPVIAGFIVLRTTWRWVMWVVVFCTGFTFVFGVIFLDETFPPLILGRKARRMRAETGNKELMTIFEASEEGESLWQKVGKNLVRPAKLLGGNLIVFILSLYMALLYGTIDFSLLYLTSQVISISCSSRSLCSMVRYTTKTSVSSD